MLLGDDGRGLHLPLDQFGVLVEGRYPRIGDVLRIMTIQIHHHDYVVTRFRGAAEDDVPFLHRPDYRYVDGVVLAVRMGVSSDYRYLEPSDPFLHTP